MKINKVTEDSYSINSSSINIFFSTYKKENGMINLYFNNTFIASIFSIEAFFDALNESNLYIEEIKDLFDPNDIDKNLYYPNEDIPEELESKKEISKETLKTALDCFRENDKIKFSRIKYELHINMEPTQGHYSECEEFFRTVDGETFKLRWDYYHEEILEISRP